METQFIKLNMIPSGVNPCFHISQYDIGRSLGFIVYNGSEVVDLDSYTCTIEATRSDGVAITASVTTDDNVGTFETTATMTNKADKYRAQFVIVDGDSNRIASLPFDMNVVKAAMDENSEAIEEDASLYQQYTEAVQGAIAEANAGIQTEKNARIAAINAEAITRANADTTLQNNIDAEATARANAITAEAEARQTADNTLQGNINSEASTRATQDASLQSQINQIIAPSGEAPSAAEVQNARIGADGITYTTLGNAIRTNDNSIRKSIINFPVSLHKSTGANPLLFVMGAYPTPAVGETADLTIPVQFDNNTTFYCTKAAINAGERITFKSYGGSSSYRTIAFYDSNFVVLQRSGVNAIESYTDAPENSAWVVINTNSSDDDFYAYIGDNVSRILDSFGHINNLLTKAVDITPYDWKTIWRTGYVLNGSGSNSNNYLRTALINAQVLDKTIGAVITPPLGYFIWADVFVNDYVRPDNFVAEYGDPAGQHYNEPVYVPLQSGQSFVVSIGKFNGNAGDYNNETFTSTIKCVIIRDGHRTYFHGKKMSLLGDSMSAFVNDIPDGNKVYYTGSNWDVENTNDMWYSVMCQDLGMEKLVINAWSGSCVTSGVRDDVTYVPASDASRCEALHSEDADPDIVILAIGTNDYSYMTSDDQFGTWDGTTALGSESDLSDYINTDFKQAYATMIARIQHKYPNAQIICLTTWYVKRRTTNTRVTYLNDINKQLNDYNKAIKEIADIMNVPVINITKIGFNRYNYYPTYASDSPTITTHLNKTGQTYAGHAIAKLLLNLYSD